MTTKEKRKVVRIVRDGAVRIGGAVYRLDKRHHAYDGRLDGMKILFGRYRKPGVAGGWEPYVGMIETDGETDVVNGTLPWMFWFEEGQQ